MTYVVLVAAVLIPLALVTLPALRRQARAPLAWTAVVLVVLTLVFDNVIVGTGIVDYDDALILGVRVPVAPIEDFSYAIAAVLVVPALWHWLRPRPKGIGDAA